jgi:hypothetical protein
MGFMMIDGEAGWARYKSIYKVLKYFVRHFAGQRLSGIASL